MMKANAHSSDKNALISCAEQLLHAGKGYDAVLAYLREGGYGKLDSMKFLCRAGKLSLIRAKEIVHDSVVWSDAFERDEELHDSLLRSVAELGLR